MKHSRRSRKTFSRNTVISSCILRWIPSRAWAEEELDACWRNCTNVRGRSLRGYHDGHWTRYKSVSSKEFYKIELQFYGDRIARALKFGHHALTPVTPRLRP